MGTAVFGSAGTPPASGMGFAYCRSCVSWRMTYHSNTHLDALKERRRQVKLAACTAFSIFRR